MFKVSFKENPNFPVKKVQRFSDDRITVVTLKDVVKLPLFLQYFIPPKIYDWIDTLKNIDVEITMSRMFITTKGKSVCSKEDKVYKVLGERIAEARAKATLYKFMCKFCYRILKYFRNELYGINVGVCFGSYGDDSVAKAVKKYEKLYNNEVKHHNTLLGYESDTESSQEH